MCFEEPGFLYDRLTYSRLLSGVASWLTALSCCRSKPRQSPRPQFCLWRKLPPPPTISSSTKVDTTPGEDENIDIPHSNRMITVHFPQQLPSLDSARDHIAPATSEVGGWQGGVRREAKIKSVTSVTDFVSPPDSPGIHNIEPSVSRVLTLSRFCTEDHAELPSHVSFVLTWISARLKRKHHITKPIWRLLIEGLWFQQQQYLQAVSLCAGWVDLQPWAASGLDLRTNGPEIAPERAWLGSDICSQEMVLSSRMRNGGPNLGRGANRGPLSLSVDGAETSWRAQVGMADGTREGLQMEPTAVGLPDSLLARPRGVADEKEDLRRAAMIEELGGQGARGSSWKMNETNLQTPSLLEQQLKAGQHRPGHHS
ncbi:hypothetical protein JZ751_026834 [Albula glossodonta]|uniref:Uncharacterized protein n=1 Tax=Albula glossodonta TaxID=121402 RepID=A0A8T2PH29_9TELE|nr:hypothetical protein JZ751_026834 [Albula glossodonta]